MEEIINFLLDIGKQSILAVVVIAYLWITNKNKADKLVVKDGERKTDTDEVARQLNNEQEVCLAKMEKDIEFIKLQVSNHLPTSIKELAGKMDNHIEKQDVFERDVLIKIAKLK